MSSPRKLLRRALDALDQIEADAARIPAARRALVDQLGPDGYDELVRARKVVARSLAVLNGGRSPEITASGLDTGNPE